MVEYDTILVPSDGSEHAEMAVEVAFWLAEQSGGVVHTLFVVDTHLYGEPALSSVELFLDDLDDLGADLLSEYVGRGSERGIAVESVVKHGTPHEVIVDYAEEIDADVIVMGQRGKSHRKQKGTVLRRVLAATDRHVLAI